MKIAKGSHNLAYIHFSITVISFIICILVWFWTRTNWIFSIFAAITIWCLFVIWTFRDPKREIILNPSFILAPADGTITKLAKTDKGIYCVIRMSPFDVHMTRSPINGKTKSIQFKKGSHWPAYFPNYAVRNQRNTIRLSNEEEKIEAVVTQVSGIFARRTISYINEGDEVKQGEVIGTIRFGSITSVEIISTKKYKLVEPLPKITRAGITKLAVQENDSD